MENLTNQSHSDFLVTFFVGKRIFSKMLSLIVKNREELSFYKTIGLPDDFQISFFFEDKNNKFFYVIRQNNIEKYIALLNGQLFNEHIISTGDYIVFKNNEGSIIAKVLFVSCEEIQIGYKKYSLPNDSEIFIGRNELNDIAFNLNDFISREKHVVIKIDKQGNACLEDLKKSVGVYVNGNIVSSQQLKPFDEVFIMGLSIVYLGKYIAVRNLKLNCSLKIAEQITFKQLLDKLQDKNYFVRTPRIFKSLDNNEIEVDAPPNPPTIDKTPAILVLGPSVTMLMVMLASLSVSATNAFNSGNTTSLIVSIIMAIGMFMGALLWPTLLRKYQQKMFLLEDEHRKKRYTAYISEIENNLIEKTDRAIRLLNEVFNPSPELLCSLLDNDKNKLRLWERSKEDSDFLSIRLGMGSKPFDVKIKIPKQGFHLYEDELRELPAKIFDRYGTISGVPLAVNMVKNSTLGIIGSREKMHTVLREIILDVISLHSYDEVKLVIITSKKQMAEYELFKNIPHIWSNDRKIRYFATNSDEVHYIFNSIEDVIKEYEISEEHPAPHYFLVVTDPFLVEKESFLRHIHNTDKKIGITTIFAYGEITKLPKSCTAIIQCDEKVTGYYIKNENENKITPFSLDTITENKFVDFINKLSALPVKRDLRTLGIPEKISFLQVYQVGNISALEIEKNWDNNNSSKSLAAPIGVMAGNEIFYLDIHESYHGCHGLVAGTTGSGKSEFLQSLILSLSVNYSPKEIAFVLVDFKGGDMARPFIAKASTPSLPHLAATISNLSGNILYRALVSFDAEIKSRQKLFNEAAAELGVDKLDINSYHRYFKSGKLRTPLPHLVIIIDEFAQLKTQQPDFLTQLINIAQVGRSLGIHLILATQKPSGLVDPQIWSNSRFKVCLKVADKQDSIDMLNKPDSAFIKNPGRLYVQVGYDEIYECVQSGYSGADYIPTKNYMPDDSVTVHMTDNTAHPIHSSKLNNFGNKTDKTQLEAVVAEIISIGQKKNTFVKPLWMDVLPTQIILEDIQKSAVKGLCTTTVGLVDYVRKQEQKDLTLDFSKTGNIALYGANGTGKTTFLQTLIYSLIADYNYTPTELNIYAMDFGGRNLKYLDLLPHTGGIIFTDEENKIAALSSILHDIIDERKRLFAENNCGTFTEFRATVAQPLPAILILIDNFATFHEKYLSLSESLFDIVSAGNTFGIYFVITGNTRNSIYYKVTENISTYFTFKMNDPANYFDIHNIRPPVIPEDINGRGITVINKEIVEFQTALACVGDNESSRISAICEKFSEIANNWNGELPIKISEADNPYYEEESARVNPPISNSAAKNFPPSITDARANLILGASKSGALNYGLILAENQKLGFLSRDNDFMLKYYEFLLKKISAFGDRQIIFIDNDKEFFKNATAENSLCEYINSVAELDAFINELKPELNARLETSENCAEQIFIIIAEYANFFNMITDEQAAFMRKVLQYINEPKYGIYFITGFNVDKDKNNDRLFMSLLVNAKNYLIAPGSYDTAATKIETLPTVPDVKANEFYFCAKDKNIALRWQN